MSESVIKLDVVSGFLGAGKTTFILRMLDTVLKGQRVAVLENEFGKVGLDGTLLSYGPLAVKEIAAGCICCDLSGSFEAGMLQLIEEQHPDRIIVEPTGVARLSDVLNTLSLPSITRRCLLERVITIVDASRFAMMEQMATGYFANQIVNAGAIAVSKAGKFSDSLLASMASRLCDYAPEAAIFTGEWTDEVVEKVCAAANLLHPVIQLPDTGEVPFQSTTVELTRPLRPRELTEKVSALDDGRFGEVLRVKGIFKDNMGSWRVLQAVPGDCRVEESTARGNGMLTVIGRKLNIPALRLYLGQMAGIKPVGRLRPRITVGKTLPDDSAENTNQESNQGG